jgi:hypothetical protein
LVFLAAAGVALVVLVCAGLAILLWYGRPQDDTLRGQLCIATIAVAGVVWLCAVWQVRKGVLPRSAVWLVLGIALAMRAATFAAPPLLSSDLNRYVWDGRVQMAGINPYRYVPAAPELAFLRDAEVYPDINRADYARTIYAPGAEWVFAAAVLVAPGVYGMKAVMLGFDLLAIAALLMLLRLSGRDATEVLIYAWMPLPVWEFAGNGHADAIAAGLLPVALLVSARGLPAIAGGVLAVATLTKFLPGVVLAAFWRPWGWRLPAGFAVVAVLLYLPYAGAGLHVFGFLGGYLREEHVETGQGFFLLGLLGHFAALPAWVPAAYIAAGAAIVGGLGLRFVAEGGLPVPAPARVATQAHQALILGAVLLVAVSPHYPWYFGWIAPLACIAPLSGALWLLAAAPLLALGPVEHLLAPVAVYLPAAGLAACSLYRRRAAPASPLAARSAE